MTLGFTDNPGDPHWPFVIGIGETEVQRQRRDWPEVPQGIQKELM